MSVQYKIPGEGTNKPNGEYTLLFLDFDDTLIRGVSWNFLAEAAGRLEEKMSYFERFNKELNEANHKNPKLTDKIYSEWIRKDASLFKGARVDIVKRAYENLLEKKAISEGFDELLSLLLNSETIISGIVSAGVANFIDYFISEEVKKHIEKNQIPVKKDLDFLVANELTTRDGFFDGGYWYNVKVFEKQKIVRNIFQIYSDEFSFPINQIIFVDNSKKEIENILRINLPVKKTIFLLNHKDESLTADKENLPNTDPYNTDFIVIDSLEQLIPYLKQIQA